MGENNCNALKEMESNEESTVGADYLHILLAGRLTLLLTQDRIYVTRMSHICEC